MNVLTLYSNNIQANIKAYQGVPVASFLSCVVHLWDSTRAQSPGCVTDCSRLIFQESGAAFDDNKASWVRLSGLLHASAQEILKYLTSFSSSDSSLFRPL